MSEPYTEFILPIAKAHGPPGALLPLCVVALPVRDRLRFLLDGKVTLLAKVQGYGYDTHVRIGQFRVRNLAGRAWRRLRSR
jgi:hypothetical protein